MPTFIFGPSGRLLVRNGVAITDESGCFEDCCGGDEPCCEFYKASLCEGQDACRYTPEVFVCVAKFPGDCADPQNATHIKAVGAWYSVDTSIVYEPCNWFPEDDDFDPTTMPAGRACLPPIARIVSTIQECSDGCGAPSSQTYFRPQGRCVVDTTGQADCGPDPAPRHPAGHGQSSTASARSPAR